MKCGPRIPAPATDNGRAFNTALTCLAHGAADVAVAKSALEQAEVERRVREWRAARLGLHAFRCGERDAGPWLVEWWNTGATSPRGDRPPVASAADIPADAEPVVPEGWV